MLSVFLCELWMQIFADKVDTADMGKLDGNFMVSRDRDDYDYVFQDQWNEWKLNYCLLVYFGCHHSTNEHKQVQS